MHLARLPAPKSLSTTKKAPSTHKIGSNALVGPWAIDTLILITAGPELGFVVPQSSSSA